MYFNSLVGWQLLDSILEAGREHVILIWEVKIDYIKILLFQGHLEFAMYNIGDLALIYNS